MNKAFMSVLATIFAILFFMTGCGSQSDSGSEADTSVRTASAVELNSLRMTRISKKYHLPFHSGETYKATTYTGHGGWDFNMTGDCGQPIIAVADGRVSAMEKNYDYQNVGSRNYGNYVRINHDEDSNDSIYAHMDVVYVSSGQWVERGQALGTIGTTGDSSGCHLHFEVRNSSNTAVESKFYYYRSGSKRNGYLSHNSSYQSYNHGKIESQRSSIGKSTVGSPTTVLASRVDDDGFSKTFTGGTWGTVSIYYQAKGCETGDGCGSYNNTNYAWLVRSGFYSYYNSCGGPRYCDLGFPTGNEYAITGGARQNFENGRLIYISSSGRIEKHLN